MDLGDITTADAFRAILERGGMFHLGDPRVHQACIGAGLGRWLTPESEA